MKVNIDMDVVIPSDGVRVGNVYNQKGGYGARDGRMFVVVSHNESVTVYLVVDKHGEIVGAASYGAHVLAERIPIAFVEGLEELELRMRSI